MPLIESAERQILRHNTVIYKIHNPYDLTIGVGRDLLKDGLSHSEAMLLLRNDVCYCIGELNHIHRNWGALPDIVKQALIEIFFDLKGKAYLKMTDFIEAIGRGNFPRAARLLKGAEWYKAHGYKANVIINQIKHDIIDGGT